MHTSPRVRTALSATIGLLLLAAPLAAQQAPSGKQAVTLPGAQRSTTLSSGIRVGNLLFLSGTLGNKPGSREMDSTIQGQTRQALENMKAVLDAAGATPGDVVKCTVFLSNVSDFAGMNEAYRAFFPADKDMPARSTVAVAALVRPDAKVEIECIAALPR